MRQYLFTLAILISISACDNSKENSVNEANPANYFLQQGDSIPLDDAISTYDSLYIEKVLKPLKDTHSGDRFIELKIQLDTLKQEFKNEPNNLYLKKQIKELEMNIELLDRVEKELNERDSLIQNVILNSQNL